MGRELFFASVVLIAFGMTSCHKNTPVPEPCPPPVECPACEDYHNIISGLNETVSDQAQRIKSLETELEETKSRSDGWMNDYYSERAKCMQYE